MNETQLAAMADELQAIEKVGGLASFLSTGIKGLKSVAKGSRKLGFGESMKRHGGAIKGMFQRGSEAVGKSGKPGGWWGGVKQVAKSPYGAMAGTAGLGGLAAYGGYKATLGRDSGQRRY